MTKTIEELAREYVNDVYSGDTDFIDEAENVQTWLFAKPLCNRLTAEEKERVRKEYSNTYPLDPDCGVANILIQGALERIFGKEFFKEDKV